ncbi:MAG: DNA polymerase III subunit alpha [Verrucomicrobia bacterium]|nr:DNA polymerase III subunit alpha [Verrucomicrobiota bacterium]
MKHRIIPGLLKLAKEFGLRVVCANDVHYVYREDYKPHDALLCIQTGKLIKDEARMRYPNQEFYLKSHAEMLQAFPDNPETLQNTLAVAEMVDLNLKFGEDHYPVFERSLEVTYHEDSSGFDRILDIYVEEKNKIQSREGKPLIHLDADERIRFKRNGEYLFDLCKIGLYERYGVDYDAVRYQRPRFTGQSDIDAERAERICQQLEYELAIITGTGFVDYFLITWDFIHWARLQEIPVGPGRGSGAGCVVAYVLKITDIDPLRFGLLFERMLNLERVSPPDFDVDFCMRRRDEVVDYVRRKYGADKVANIITYGKFGAKMVVRDLARVMSMEYVEANKLAKMVPDDLNISLDDAIAKSHELQAEIARNPTVAEIMRQGKVIEGMVRNTGKHACGIIISDQPLTELVPVTLQEGALTTQYAKGPVEELGLLKCDFLGLKTLTVISDAQEFVRQTTGNKDFDIEKVSLEDAETYALLNSGKTTGVFQLESGGMQALCRQIGLSSFEEIIALIALYRPGPMQFIDQYIKGKKDPTTVVVPHPLLKDLVLETYGVLVYQEQVMEAARIVAGYTLGGADMLRRAMGKKVKEIMDQQKEIFIAGAKEKNNIDRKTAEEIFAILEKFAQYGFNKSHSAAYAMLSYRTAFLKANYPVEFMAAVLGCEVSNPVKVSHFIEECASMNVDVLGPDVNESGASFTPVIQKGKSSIRFGLAAIKGVGDGAAEAIIIERKRNGAFKDFEDFVSRMDSKVVNRRVLENLVKTGHSMHSKKIGRI